MANTPKLTMYDPANDRIVDVPETQVMDAVRAGYEFKKDEKINLIWPGGLIEESTPEKAYGDLEMGARIELPSERLAQEEREEFRGRGLEAFGTAAASGFTLGLSDQLLTHGSMSERELDLIRRYNTGASLLGEGVGVLASSLVPGGPLATAGKAAAKVGKSARVISTLGELGKAGKVAKYIVPRAARGATEGALMGAGTAISEDALGRHELTAENLMAHMGTGALIGGAFDLGLAAGIDAVGSTGSKLYRKLTSMIPEEKLGDVRARAALFDEPFDAAHAEVRRRVFKEDYLALTNDVKDVAKDFNSVVSDARKLYKKIENDLIAKYDKFRTIEPPSVHDEVTIPGRLIGYPDEAVNVSGDVADAIIKSADELPIQKPMDPPDIVRPRSDVPNENVFRLGMSEVEPVGTAAERPVGARGGLKPMSVEVPLGSLRSDAEILIDSDAMRGAADFAEDSRLAAMEASISEPKRVPLKEALGQRVGLKENVERELDELVKAREIAIQERNLGDVLLLEEDIYPLIRELRDRGDPTDPVRMLTTPPPDMVQQAAGQLDELKDMLLQAADINDQVAGIAINQRIKQLMNFLDHPHGLINELVPSEVNIKRNIARRAQQAAQPDAQRAQNFLRWQIKNRNFVDDRAWATRGAPDDPWLMMSKDEKLAEVQRLVREKTELRQGGETLTPSGGPPDIPEYLNMRDDPMFERLGALRRLLDDSDELTKLMDVKDMNAEGFKKFVDGIEKWRDNLMSFTYEGFKGKGVKAVLEDIDKALRMKEGEVKRAAHLITSINKAKDLEKAMPGTVNDMAWAGMGVMAGGLAGEGFSLGGGAAGLGAGLAIPKIIKGVRTAWKHPIQAAEWLYRLEKIKMNHERVFIKIAKGIGTGRSAVRVLATWSTLKLITRPSRKEDTRKSFERISSDIISLSSDPDRVGEAVWTMLGPIEPLSPKTYAHVTHRTRAIIDWLNAQMPKGAAPTMFDKGSEPPEPAMKAWLRKAEAALKPIDALKRMAHEGADMELMNVIEQLYPELTTMMRATFVEEFAGKKPSYAQRLQLSILLGEPVDRSTDPSFITAMNRMMEQKRQESAVKTAPGRKQRGPSRIMTQSQRMGAEKDVK